MSRFSRTARGAALLPLLLPLSLAAQDKAPPSATLVYKSLPKWNLILPKEEWTSFTTAIPIPHAGDAKGFAAQRVLMTVSVDSDGDGKTETQVKGTSGYVELRGKNAAGKAFTYAARISNDGTAGKFAASGVMVGSLNGTAISLIDANNNGTYNEIGKDAIIVGDGRAASWLSKVINLKTELHSIEVSADGTTVTSTPYAGESGTLELRSGFKSLGELDSIVVTDDRLGCSFNLAQQKSLLVPVGSYVITGGFAHKANESAYIGGGKMRPISVERNKTASMDWGSTVTAEFDFSHNGTEVTVQPNIKFYGRAGEEYYQFKPEAKSPKFFVFDKDTKKQVGTGRFGGC
jgi:hypothetical protein